MAQYSLKVTEVSVDTSKYFINDNPARKIASVFFEGTQIRLVLWQGDAYTAAGDYTQAQVDARIAELLGADPIATLTGLIPKRLT